MESSSKSKKAKLAKTEVLQQTERINSATTPVTTNSVRHLLGIIDPPDNFKPVVQVLAMTTENKDSVRQLLGIVDPPDNFKPVVQVLAMTTENKDINSDDISSKDFFWCLAISDGEYIVHGALVDSKLGDDLFSERILSQYSFIRLESCKTFILIEELTVLHNLQYSFGSPVWYDGEDNGPITQDKTGSTQVCNQFK
jgi:hypothetical protein